MSKIGDSLLRLVEPSLKARCHVNRRVTEWAHLPNGFMSCVSGIVIMIHEGGVQLFLVYNKSSLHYAATKECLNLVSQLDGVNLFSGR